MCIYIHGADQPLSASEIYKNALKETQNNEVELQCYSQQKSDIGKLQGVKLDEATCRDLAIIINHMIERGQY